MYFRMPTVTAALLATLVFLIAACGGNTYEGEERGVQTSHTSPPETPVTQPTPTPSPNSATMSVTDLSPSAETPEPEYLTESVPPCTPVEGVSIEPCAGVSPWVGSTPGHRDFDTQPRDLAWFLGGDRIVWARHFVIRCTYLPNTARCFVDNEYHGPSYLNTGSQDFGSREINSIKCYADVRVNEYLIGSGPSKLTLRVARPFYGIPMTEAEVKEEFAALEAALTGGAPHWRLEVPEGGIIGVESILFIGPSYDVTEDSFLAIDAWGLRTKDDGTVAAVHPYKAYWDYRIAQGDAVTDPGILEIDLPTFRTRLTAVHQGRLSAEGGIAARPEYPPLMTDANRLRQFLVEVGALDNPGFPLKPIPPACGRSVTDQAANRELFDDCATLLAIKDTLRGSGSLNWALGTPIANWNGITVGGTLKRVTKLKLTMQSLTGSIPAQLGDLDGLDELKLAGNQLTGCLPLAVKAAAPSNNDLTALGLGDCQPAPNKPSVGTVTETSIALSWPAVGGASRYGVEYRPTRTESWNVSTDAVTAQPHTVTGLTCEQEYLFRVSAFGDGTTYAAEWSDPSVVVKASTAACVTPTFGAASYTFVVNENASTGDEVGTVSATDPNRDTLTYSITEGNDDGHFTIDDETGVITVNAALDHETTDEYTLTVQASDGTNVDTATVVITVTNVAEGSPPAPAGLTVTLAGGTFSLTWDAVSGVGKYEAQYTTDAADAATVTWTALPEVTTASAAYTPVGGPACSTEYRFRVRAYGDGETYIETWGAESGVETVATAATATCPPEFGRDPYAFTVSEDAQVDHPVGTVSATDPDQDTLSYFITEGNDGGQFAIDSSSGAITVAGELSHDASPTHTLTVEARDGHGGTTEAVVTISVSSVCRNGVVLPNHADNPGLVEDCLVLYKVRDALAGTVSLDWDGDTALRSWQGVRVRGEPSRVQYLLLADLGLTGVIPPELGALDALRRLDLDGNELTGEIPSQLGDLSNLAHLYLFDNELRGPIPATLRRLSELTDLWLDDNELSGSIPATLGDLEELEALGLGGNGLTGAIPAELANLAELHTLYLNSNQLSGPMPTGLGNLSKLEVLHVYGNELTGEIPAELGSLTKLRQLILADNELSGAIPATLGGLSRLTYLWLNDNELTGEIPAELGEIPDLEEIYVAGNSFTGCVPPGLRDVDGNDLDATDLRDCGPADGA